MSRRAAPGPRKLRQGLLALFILVLVPSPAFTQTQPSQTRSAESLPAPWSHHPYPARFRQLGGLACSDDAAFLRSWQGPFARLEASGVTPLARVPGRGSAGEGLWVNREGTRLFTNAGGAIVHHRDGEWTRFEAPLGHGYAHQIVSFDGEHAFAVGPGRVVAWSGDQYAAFDPGTWRDLGAIAGVSEDDFWVGGQRGAVLHFDGQSFSSRRIETEGVIVQLFRLSSDDLWAVTERPSGAFHWDGTAWTERTPEGDDLRLSAVGGDAANVYAVGNFGVLRWRQDGWEDVYRFEFSRYAMARFQAVCATRTHVVVAEDRNGAWIRPLEDTGAAP